MVVIAPRRTATCDIADLHLALEPGTDAILFSGLLAWLYQQGHGDARFVADCTESMGEALHLAGWYAPSAEAVARHCGLDVGDVETFFRWFAGTERTVTVYSQGINQSSSGTDKVNAIINCHLLTGRIGRPGMGPFSVTGQPNAMGGREVGALANQLAAHMDFDNPEHVDRVARFWGAAHMARRPGLKALELFQAVERGEVKALWVMATNPAVSMPDASQVRRALEKCEFLVVSDCVAQTDTSVHADVLLPALAWGEKEGTVTNSERRVSRQRAFLNSPGEARPDWWIVSAVARRLGYAGFGYRSAHEIFTEHARLSAFENNGARDFDLSGLADLSGPQYHALAPVQWPVTAGQARGQAREESGVRDEALAAPQLAAGLAVEGAHHLDRFVAGLGNEDPLGGDDRPRVAAAELDLPQRLEARKVVGPRGAAGAAVTVRPAPLRPLLRSSEPRSRPGPVQHVRRARARGGDLGGLDLRPRRGAVLLPGRRELGDPGRSSPRAPARPKPEAETPSPAITGPESMSPARPTCE